MVDLPLLQRKLNFHASVTRDLFGSEVSSNAAEAFGSGIKGRFNEANLKGDDHVLQDATYPVTRVVDGKLVEEQTPALRALNSRLLDDFIVDCQAGSILEQVDRKGRRRLQVRPAAQRLHAGSANSEANASARLARS